MVVESPATLAADVAASFFGDCVSTFVKVQVDFQPESLLAHGASVWPIARVPEAVFAQAGLVGEPAPTIRTGIRPDLWLGMLCGTVPADWRDLEMGLLVQGALFLIQETLTTIRTHIWRFAGKHPFLDDDGGEICNISSRFS